MNKKVFLSAAAAFVAAGALAVAPISAATTEGSDKNTTVTYTNVDAVSPNGLYGIVIPATMSFGTSTDTPTMDIEMIGVNGYTLTDFSDVLRVDLKAQSANDMVLVSSKDSTKKVAYEMAFGASESTAMTLNTASGSKATAVAVAKFSVAKPKVTVTGSLVDPGNATIKDTYSDVVTFSWADNGTILK